MKIRLKITHAMFCSLVFCFICRLWTLVWACRHMV